MLSMSHNHGHQSKFITPCQRPVLGAVAKIHKELKKKKKEKRGFQLPAVFQGFISKVKPEGRS